MVTRLPVLGGLEYEVNELGQVMSLPRTIMRKCRHTGKPTPYNIGGKILKHDVKFERGLGIARVQLYNSELKYRECYYVARMVYALFNHKNYHTMPNIHYKDGNSLNCALDNLYETEDPRQNKRGK